MEPVFGDKPEDRALIAALLMLFIAVLLAIGLILA